MTKYLTNKDKILHAVLSDTQLMSNIDYNLSDYNTIQDALYSDCPIIQAIAIIIERNAQNATEREIYNEVNNILKDSL